MYVERMASQATPPQLTDLRSKSPLNLQPSAYISIAVASIVKQAKKGQGKGVGKSKGDTRSCKGEHITDN